MNISTRLSLCLFVAALSLNSLPAFADSDQVCRLNGSYAYLYNGTSYTPSGPVPLTETGVFTVDESDNVSGEGTLAFQYSNFYNQGPLWLLLSLVGLSGVVTPDANNPCTGIVDFVTTATVIKTSKPSLVPIGYVLFSNETRSIAYTISKPPNEIVEMISTSPGTIASGTAHKQDTNKSKVSHK